MRIDIAKTEPLFTTREVAERLHVDSATVRGWVKDGLLPAIELPTKGKRHSYRFKASVISAIYENTQISGGNVIYDTKQQLAAPAR